MPLSLTVAAGFGLAIVLLAVVVFAQYLLTYST